MKRIIIWLIVIVLAALAFVYYAKKHDLKSIMNNQNPIVATSTTADSNSNGNSVSNSNNAIPLDWVATSSSGVSFKYPSNLGTKYTYVRPTDWPPVVSIKDQAYNCLEGGNAPSDRAGITQKKMINGQEYCVTEVGDGAAGSVYHQYTYAFPYQYRTANLTFTFQFPQCMNYDEPKQSACKAEEEAFNIGPVIASIRYQIGS